MYTALPRYEYHERVRMYLGLSVDEFGHTMKFMTDRCYDNNLVPFEASLLVRYHYGRYQPRIMKTGVVSPDDPALMER